ERTGRHPKGFFLALGGLKGQDRERRALDTASGVGGHTTYLPEHLPYLRPKLVCALAGATVKPFGPFKGAKVALPRITAGANVSWVSESAAPSAQSNFTTVEGC